MLRNRRSTRSTVLFGLSLLVSAPLITGQACPGPGDIRPVTPNFNNLFGGAATRGASGNFLPSFTFDSPLTDLSREIGDIITISWHASDPDNNAAITIFLDPDGVFGNGNERAVLPLVLEDSGQTSFDLNTAAESLTPASYRIVARMTDGINPELLVVAPGKLLLFGQGLLPGNISPSIIVTQPVVNIGASQNDIVNITYCGRDPDNGEGGFVPDIVLILDFDDNPDNDLDLSSATAATTLAQICQGGLPANINGGIVISCSKENDCGTGGVAPTQFSMTIDVGLFPPTPSGEPYRIRATIWDHTNRPVHSYAPGRLNITAFGSGIVDLGGIGRTINGAKFLGFDAGSRTGTSASGLGDFDGDGVEDFVLVSQFGKISSTSNVGSAHVIMGLPNGQKFGGEVPLNSLTTQFRGTMLSMPNTGFTTEGIQSVARVNDVTGDNRSEIIFGIPYVEQFFDFADDDPWDCPSDETIACYTSNLNLVVPDLFPNPFSEEDQPDNIGATDFDEIFGCNNDQDLQRETPINGGYAVMLSSENTVVNQIIGLDSLGQNHVGAAPFGARWRGPWYDEFDFTQTRLPFAIIPDNRFGQTVNSMPFMTDTAPGIPLAHGPSVLISAPMASRGRGRVTHHPDQNFPQFVTNNCVSFPVYTQCLGGCPPLIPCRTLTFPGFHTIIGAAIGDNLGYAASAGDFNLDGSYDIACGAPGADRGGLSDGGIVYIIFGRPDFGGLNLENSNPPRMEIHGTNAGDQLGRIQTVIGDINHDGLADVAFASEFADGPGGADAGFIGIVFGGRRLTGENIFTVNQVATSQLPGTKIFGSQRNGNAGRIISNVGDFNGDGTDDLLICAPNETRIVNSQTRRGVAYLLFGGPHLNNVSLNLNQAGTSVLPGIVFTSPYAVGTADEAAIDGLSGVGDINGDGFADILIGVSTADYVNPLEPSQRRVDSGEAYLIYGSNTGSNSF